MVKANQANSQITLLEQEIGRLKYALESKNGQVNNKNKEVEELMRRIALFQEQISSLRAQGDRKTR